MAGKGPYTENTPSAQLVGPSTQSCGLFDGVQNKKSPNPLNLIVKLVVVDASGNLSAEMQNTNVSVTPVSGACGFSGF